MTIRKITKMANEKMALDVVKVQSVVREKLSENTGSMGMIVAIVGGIIVLTALIAVQGNVDTDVAGYRTKIATWITAQLDAVM